MKHETLTSTKSNPLLAAIATQTTTSILTSWPFSTNASRSRFLAADIPSLTCCLFPYAIEERIHIAASLVSLLLLLDDELPELTVDEGEEFLEYLRIAVGGGWQGEEEEDENQPAVSMLSGVLDELKGTDYEVGGEVVGAMWEWLRSRNVSRRSRRSGPDVMRDFYRSLEGTELRWHLMRFVMDVSADGDLERLGLRSPRRKVVEDADRGRTRRRRCEKGVDLKTAPVVIEREIPLEDLSPV
ncbi:unnamed protein product [Zymoseptoria tritici ST99CH_1E4]|uniref:Uncharacterized protein n=1 Tax=Zymoseptoria tritici ST99CH_1E4 TaxID=1276532 RepID=A0A2H1FZP4_ZYMTR|nr:unnamed protein product [Zymoseptoria tritici ST99CH_1E4]